MPAKRIIDLLDGQNVKYALIRHSPAYTAQEIAASAHIPGKELGKTVMVKLNGTMAMAVLPASYQVDFELLKEVTGTEDVELAAEEEFKDIFPGCETGAMPPFGNLYGLDVFVAESLAEDEMIAFNAGTHKELIQMRYEDFDRLVEPKVVAFSARA